MGLTDAVGWGSTVKNAKKERRKKSVGSKGVPLVMLQGGKNE